MRRVRSLEIVPLDPEIERTISRLRREHLNRNRAMAEGNNNNQQRALRDYFRPVVNENYSGIRRQTINANNFELKPTLINMVQ